MGTQPLPGPDWTDLVAAIHQGPLAPSPWSDFTALLRQTLSANAASFSFRIDNEVGPGVLAASPVPDEPVYGYIFANGLDAVGPPPGGAALKPRRLYGVADFLDRTIPKHREFEERVMKPHGLTHMRVARIPEPTGGSAWLAVGRDSADFSLDEEMLLMQLLPHVELSLQTYFAIERERSRSRIAIETTGKLDFCWLRLDAACRIVDHDHQAQKLLARSEAVARSPRGELALALPAAQRQLEPIVRELAGREDGRPRALHVSDDPWLDLLVVPARGNSPLERMAPGVIVYIHGESGSSGDRREALGELFGLTRREAELTLALCRGQTIREAAAAIGLTEASAREYSKRIYAKTGTRGQVDLVRLVLTSIVALV